MPKKIKFESTIYHILSELREFANLQKDDTQQYDMLKRFINSLEFEYVSSSEMNIKWRYPNTGYSTFNYNDSLLYVRGDKENYKLKKLENLVDSENPSISSFNKNYFNNIVHELLRISTIIRD